MTDKTIDLQVQRLRFAGIQDAFLIVVNDDDTRHTILLEQDRSVVGRWVARDSCDRGVSQPDKKGAILAYVLRSRHANRGGMGHSEWLLWIGLPAIEKFIDTIITDIKSLED